MDIAHAVAVTRLRKWCLVLALPGLLAAGFLAWNDLIPADRAFGILLLSIVRLVCSVALRWRPYPFALTLGGVNAGVAVLQIIEMWSLRTEFLERGDVLIGAVPVFYEGAYASAAFAVAWRSRLPLPGPLGPRDSTPEDWRARSPLVQTFRRYHVSIDVLAEKAFLYTLHTVLGMLSRDIPGLVLGLLTIPARRHVAERIRIARQQSILRADQLMRQDTRPPVLLLRCFGDDQLLLDTGRSSAGSEEIAPITFESWLVARLFRWGPVIAIGDPKEQLPPLGAARQYVGALDWHTVVHDLLARVRVVVIWLGVTEGLLWEMQTILEMGLLSKTLIVVPPVSAPVAAARWATLSRFLSEMSDGPNIEALSFSRDGSVFIVPGRFGQGLHIKAAARTGSAYGVGLPIAVGAVTGRR